MEEHEHPQPTNVSNESFFKRHRWLSLVALAILLYFLLVEHRQHIWPYLPFLFLLACPFMHFFMHGRHKKHPQEGNKENGQ